MTPQTVADAIAANTPTSLDEYVKTYNLGSDPLTDAMVRLTAASERIIGQPRVAVRSSDLRLLLEAYADAHQIQMVAAGQTADTYRQVIDRAVEAAA